jgi:hypothetical protein
MNMGFQAFLEIWQPHCPFGPPETRWGYPSILLFADGLWFGIWADDTALTVSPL